MIVGTKSALQNYLEPKQSRGVAVGEIAFAWLSGTPENVVRTSFFLPGQGKRTCRAVAAAAPGLTLTRIPQVEKVGTRGQINTVCGYRHVGIKLQ